MTETGSDQGGRSRPQSQGPRGVLVLEGRQIAANHLLSSVDDTLQPALVLGNQRTEEVAENEYF